MTENVNQEKGSENTARASLKEIPISAKHSIEICSRLKNKTVEEAKKYLEAVKNMEQPVKFTRFTEGAGHKRKIGSGKFPVKAAENILKAVKSAESNAQIKGFSRDLKIISISANRASRPWHYGRQRRIKMKRTHIEVIVKEFEQKKKQPVKTESKPEVEEKQVQKESQEKSLKEVKEKKEEK
ncbi:50S ribosomal protein L22 [Candidatus Woesearchaeota archaeon]|nr:50S ribosomal protein L22 [Candidatus Woesearchaeota archaeon]